MEVLDLSVVKKGELFNLVYVSSFSGFWQHLFWSQSVPVFVLEYALNNL